jgi:hypothetical protein
LVKRVMGGRFPVARKPICGLPGEVDGLLTTVPGRPTLLAMASIWARLTRRIGMTVQAADTGAEERGSHASERRRERQEAHQEVRREFSGGDPRSPGAWGGPHS